MTFKPITRGAVLGLALWSPALLAQHADIEAIIDPAGSASGTIIVDPHDEALLTTAIKPGRKLFESEFGELGSPFTTNDPGFDVPDGNGVADSILGFQVLDSLLKWDGSSWVSSGFDEHITIDDVVGSAIEVSAMGGSGLSGLIDQFDAGGGIHSHIDFEIGSSSGTPMDGAYLLELSLFGLESNGSTPLYNASDAFLIAFHLNDSGSFDEAAFESAVGALAPIPVPAAVWLLGSAVLALCGLGRSRRRNS